MRTNNLRIFFMLFFSNATFKKYFLGVWIGLAFSISVILSTIGLMDGFEKTLRLGLKLSSGDIVMQSRNGFFTVDNDMLDRLSVENISQYAPHIQTDSFLIYNDESRGVLVKAVNEDYAEVVGMDLNLNEHETAIGSEIARIHHINVGDEIVLAFGKGGHEYKNMPSLHTFKVVKLITHGVFQKDSRMLYVPLNDLQQILGIGKKVNLISLNVDRSEMKKGQDELNLVETKIQSLRDVFDYNYLFKPYWREFSSFIEAVRAEKVLISLILQLIVIISVFNILAFIYFINEKKAKELFLFKALGVSRNAINRMWLMLVGFIWICSCLLSIFFVQIFKFLLLKLSFFELPAEVYHMPRIALHISALDYALVFGLTLVWILLITYFLLRKLRKKSLLEGLRQEFA